MLYGGYNDVGELFLNDAWEWDGSDWQAIIFESEAPKTANFGLVQAPLYQHAFTFFSDIYGTWVLQDEEWTRKVMAIEPLERSSFRMVYDPVQEQTVLFGGLRQDQYLNDTWLFDGETWRETKFPRTPAGRWGPVMVYDPIRKRVVLFGGFDGTNYLNDMWELVISE
jgi:hypothetical protein